MRFSDNHCRKKKHKVSTADQVSRSLAACQGVLLLVDATQGVQVCLMWFGCAPDMVARFVFFLGPNPRQFLSGARSRSRRGAHHFQNGFANCECRRCHVADGSISVVWVCVFVSHDTNAGNRLWCLEPRHSANLCQVWNWYVPNFIFNLNCLKLCRSGRDFP